MAGVVQVSVVIPVFNRAAIVGRAIASVIQQSHCDWEVVVVDDASEDFAELRAVVDGFNDPRVWMVRHDSNQGGGAARNTGVRVARGQYIAFLDSDDEWVAPKLQVQIDHMARLAGDQWLVFCQSWVHTIQENRPNASVMPRRPLEEGERISNYLFVGRGWLQTSSMLLPRELALKVPFNPALRRHQDYDLLLRLEAEGCRFSMVTEPLVVVHWEDMHQSFRGLDPGVSIRFLNEYRIYFSRKARSGFVCRHIVTRLLCAGRRKEACKYFLCYTLPFHLSFMQWVVLVSSFLYGDPRVARWFVGLKNRVGSWSVLLFRSILL
jgi:glycosyltransferase involved in cell wall biosynthesis